MSSRAEIFWPDAYPEREDRSASAAENFGRAALGVFAGRIASHGPDRSLPASVLDRQRGLRALADAGLRDKAQALRLDLRITNPAEVPGPELMAKSFALVREAARRALGMQHFDSQLLAGAALMRGRVVEMPTGEGKTLAATLAAATQALSGIPVHIITANDYLAARDAAEMGGVYQLLGLSVGAVTAAVPAAGRRAAYACDIAYCSNKQIVFDYLRDRCTMGTRTPASLQFERLSRRHAGRHQPMMRGLRSAIVDEADSVLIDETRTPLILSQRETGERTGELESAALRLAEALVPGQHYACTSLTRKVQLTEAGRSRLRREAEGLGGIWHRARWREEFTERAIAALELYRRDEDYLVRDGEVQLIDEHTGRVTPGRTWSQGLHQLIESKEGVSITHEPETLARISYQRFFRRYRRLAGMTGTARESAAELWSVYGLRVTAIAPHRPSRRTGLPVRVFATAGEKWRHVVDRVGHVHATGQPLLIGTASVSASEQLSAMLSDAGLAHDVLNARQDHAEAVIVARAGEQGRITVATNMAGRGTDIRLGEGVAELGGLHIIVTERHEAARIDRQLIGRAARQGDPGSYEYALSLDDALLDRSAASVTRRIAAWSLCCGHRPAAVLMRLVQWRMQRHYARLRKQLLRADHRVDDRLVFAGRSE